MAKQPSSRSVFAHTRSHEASKIAYDMCKVTAQTCILINGGAATAIVAILAKETHPAIVSAMPYALPGYAFGVAASAFMLFCVLMMADNWNYFWYYTSYDKHPPSAKVSETHANFWHWCMYISFSISCLCFIIGSIAISHSLYKATSNPVNIIQPAPQKK